MGRYTWEQGQRLNITDQSCHLLNWNTSQSLTTIIVKTVEKLFDWVVTWPWKFIQSFDNSASPASPPSPTYQCCFEYKKKPARPSSQYWVRGGKASVWSCLYFHAGKWWLEIYVHFPFASLSFVHNCSKVVRHQFTFLPFNISCKLYLACYKVHGNVLVLPLRNVLLWSHCNWWRSLSRGLVHRLGITGSW